VEVHPPFSNASGSTQYLQLFVNEVNENGVGPFTVTASGHTFNFVTNLVGDTTNTWILIGTSNLNGPGGVPPDYIIPPNFFSTGGGTLVYASGVDTWNYGAVPVDGVHELKRDGTTPVNLATNFHNQSAQVAIADLRAVPAFATWGIVAFVGVLLVLGSGLLRQRRSPSAAV